MAGEARCHVYVALHITTVPKLCCDKWLWKVPSRKSRKQGRRPVNLLQASDTLQTFYSESRPTSDGLTCFNGVCCEHYINFPSMVDIR